MNTPVQLSTVFHGGLTRVERIDFSRCSPGKDFGRGFYTTTSKEQAERFSKIKKKRAGAAEAFISVYDCQLSADLLIHRFTAPDLGWLDFVLFNRGFLDKGKPVLSPCPRLPDIIIGPVANDTVGVVLGLLTNGAFGDPSSETAKSIAITQLRTEKLFDQVFFATRAAASSLTFKEAYVA
ncbi:MAG: DUF3990 domain-containing protein [Kiritimatiellia bacterium]